MVKTNSRLYGFTKLEYFAPKLRIYPMGVYGNAKRNSIIDLEALKNITDVTTTSRLVAR
jgi:hypothetical protein